MIGVLPRHRLLHIMRQPILPLFLGTSLGVLATLSIIHRTTTPDSTPVPATVVSSVAPIATPAPTSAAIDAGELERLTRQNATLTAELADARTRLAERDTQLATTREHLEELRRPLSQEVLSSTVNARLKSGEAVVTGGYLLPDGNRLYAFVQPELIDVDGSPQVRLQGRFNLLDDETGARVGLDSIATNAANTLQHGEVWIRDELDSVLADLTRTPGVSGIILPEMTVRPGGTATLQLEDPVLTLKVTPVPTGTGDDLDLEVRLEQTPPPPPEETSPVDTSPPSETPAQTPATASSGAHPTDATAP